MAREFEIVSNPHFRNMHVFLVHMVSRTPHIHRELEIGYVLEGSISLRIGNEIHRLEPSDGYLINPLDAHEFHSEGSDAIILAIQISPRIMESFFSDVSMMRYAGSARAMSNACYVLRAFADEVLGSNAEHAVQKDMQRILDEARGA